MKNNLNEIEKQRLIKAIKFLKEQKIAKSISQICEICGVNPGYLRDIESKNSNFSQIFLQKLFANFPINEDYILTGNGEILLSGTGNSVAQVGETHNAPGGVVQNIANNGNGNVAANANTTPTVEPSFAEMLQQLVATNAKLVETNAQLVAMLNTNINQ